jgi:hypothetical protein
MREINLQVSDELDIGVWNDTNYFIIKKDKIPLGYAGEDEATQLNVYLDSTFDGDTFYLTWDNEEYDEVTENTADDADSPTLEYEVPDTYMTKGVHRLRIEIHSSNVMKTDWMYFEVR